jgi:hypothetical protein
MALIRILDKQYGQSFAVGLEDGAALTFCKRLTAQIMK